MLFDRNSASLTTCYALLTKYWCSDHVMSGVSGTKQSIPLLSLDLNNLPMDLPPQVVQVHLPFTDLHFWPFYKKRAKNEGFFGSSTFHTTGKGRALEVRLGTFEVHFIGSFVGPISI